MKKLSKKILTVLLALALVVSVATVAALATSASAPVTLKVNKDAAADATARADGATFKTLDAALKVAKDNDTIQLESDLTIDAAATATEKAKAAIAVDKAVTIDLNEKKITLNGTAADATNTYGQIVVSKDVTIKNGTIESKVNKSTSESAGLPCAIKITGDGTDLTLNKVKVSTDNGFGIAGIEGKCGTLTIDKDSEIVAEKDSKAAAVANFATTLTIDVYGKVTMNGTGSAINGAWSEGDVVTTNINVKKGATVTGKTDTSVASSGSVAAGILMMSKGTVTVDGTVTGDTGISMTLGNLVVNEGAEITGNGTYSDAYTASVDGKVGDTGAGIYVDPAGKVSVTVNGGEIESTSGNAFNAPADTNTRNNNLELTVTGGEFKGGTEKDAVNVDTTNVTPDHFEDSVKGGFFSSPVNKDLLDDNLKYSVEGADGNYSYYNSKAAANEAAVKLGAKEEPTQLTDVNSADIVEVGFLEKKNDDKLNGFATTYKGEAWNTPVTDSADNTFYVVFKAAEKDATSGNTYTVTFARNGTVVDVEEVTDVKKAGIVYFINTKASENNHTNIEGEYTVNVYEGEKSSYSSKTAVSTMTFDVYKIDYKADPGADGGECHRYVGKESLTEATDKYVPDTFKLQAGVNDWTRGKSLDEDKHTYTVSIGGRYVSPIDPEHKCPTTTQFKDMEIYKGEKLWYHEAMDYMVLNKYIQGYDDGTLQPNATATRAQTWVIVAQIKGILGKGEEVWWGRALEWAKGKNYTDGAEPTRDITREELVEFLWKVEGQPKADAKFLDAFPDKATVADSAKTAMAWAVSKNILSGKDHELDGKIYLDPQSTGTRAEIAVLIYNWATLMK